MLPNDFLPTFKLDANTLAYPKPDEEIAEKQKYEDNGYWFLTMNRWITCNFFNPFRSRFYNNEEFDQRTCDVMIEDFAYYYGRQQNNTFNYQSQIDQNNTVQAVFIPDQKIRSLIDHMAGNAIKIIQPIKESISCKVLSEDAIKGKEKLKKNLEAKQQLGELIDQIPGITFAPAGMEQIEKDADIDEIADKFKSEEELKLIKVAQGIYYTQDLAAKFEKSSLHEFVGNVSTFLVDVNDDQTDITFFPCYNSIVDFRATDDFLSDALVGGGIQFLSPAEIFAKWGNELNEDEQNEINQLSQQRYSNWNEVYTYYNIGCPNLTWWCSDTGKISCSTTYWIGRKDLRYRKKETQYGGTKYQFIDSKKEYDTPEGKKKGDEIAGDKWGWFVHKATVIGNRYLVNYGYHPIQIRPQGKRQKPMLPTVQYVHKMELGYARSVVNRLRHFSDEKGRLMLKIQELTGRDIGKTFVLYASKLGLTEKEIPEVYKDLRTLGFALINDLGEPGGDDKPSNMRADTLDFSLAPSVTAYVELCREQDRYMSDMVNLPNPALGTQTTTIGKGVMEQTIQQSSYGQISLYNGLIEHWRRVMAYALNVEKTLNAGKKKQVQTSADDAYLIELSKKLKYEEIGLHLELNDPLDAEDKVVLKQSLHALMQNGGDPRALQSLLTTMKLLSFNSTVEGVKHLEREVEKQTKQAMAQQGAMTANQQQHEANLQKMNGDIQIALKQFQEDNANYRNNVTNETKLLAKKIDGVMQLLNLQQQQTPPPLAAQLVQGQAEQQPQETPVQ